MALDFPASPTNGQVFSNYIYDSSLPGWRNINTSQGVALQYASGLVPIVPTSVVVGSGTATINARGAITFSGSSSISINNVFSSEYENYRVLFNSQSSTVNGNSVYLRLRSAGTDASGGNYYGGAYRITEGGTFQSYGLFAQTAAFMIDVSNNTIASFSSDIKSPYSSTKQTNHITDHIGFYSSTYVGQSGHTYSATTSFDGFTMYCASGNFSGTVQIYGYK